MLVINQNSNIIMKSNSSKSQLINNRNKVCQGQREESGGRGFKKERSVNKIKDNKSKHTSEMRDAKQFNINLIKWQQLFSIIDTFYEALCNLPLQKLLSSTEPHIWLKQQQQTLHELNKKLSKAIKSKDYEYFRWKLESVGKILDNIKDNMSMLTRMNHLKNYYSGTDTSNYRSRGSSSAESDIQGLRQGSLSNQSEQKQMLSYDRYIIKPTSQTMSEHNSKRSPQILAETVQSDEEDSSEEQLAARSQIFQNKGFKRQRNVPKEGENRNTMNKAQQNLNSSKTKQGDMKDKTLAKLPYSKAAYSERTVSNYIGNSKFLEDRILQDTIQQSQAVQTYLQNTIDDSKVNSAANIESKANQNNKNYIDMIKQMRLQLLMKDRELENLLINQQEYEQSFQLFSSKQKQKNTEILFLKQNISNLNKQKAQMMKQLTKMHDQQQELRETIRFQRDRNRKQQRQKQKLQERFYEQSSSQQQLNEELTHLKQENKQCKRNERVMKQKLQVYTKRYYSVYRQLQESKQAEQLLMTQIADIRNNRSKNHTHYEQIKSIIQYHKQKLSEQSLFL